MKTYSKYLFYGMTPQLPYLSSAIGQQIILHGAIYFLPLHEYARFIIATVIFSVVMHLPNVKLIILTFLFSVIFFPIIYFGSPYLFFLLPVFHAGFGTALYLMKFDLAVWRYKS